MKHSDIMKEKSCNRNIRCSGNRICKDCKQVKKENKKVFSRAARRELKKDMRNQLHDDS